MEFQVAAAGGIPCTGRGLGCGCASLGSAQQVPVGDDLFDQHRRRPLVGLDAGLHSHHAADGGNHKPPVPALPPGWLGRPVALSWARPSACRKRCRQQPVGPALGVLQLLAGDPEQAVAAAHPETTVVVFHDLVHSSLNNPCLVVKAVKVPVLVAVEPAAPGANPQGLVAVFVERVDEVVRKALPSREILEVLAVPGAQPGLGANPQVARWPRGKSPSPYHRPGHSSGCRRPGVCPARR